MKKNIVSLVLVVLLIAIAVAGGCQGENLKQKIAEQESLIANQKSQIAEQKSQITLLTDNITKLEAQNLILVQELEGNLAKKDAQIAELTEQNTDLEAEIEYLRQPPPEKVSGEIAGYISYKETVELKKRFFPKSRGGTAGSTKDPYPLATVETLNKFLANDRTNSSPPSRISPYDAGDGWAFQLKDHWIKAGLPVWSLGLVKLEIDTQYGRMLVWRNIFLTKENGEFVFYEVNPCTDEMIKIEEPSEKYLVVMITDKLWIIN